MATSDPVQRGHLGVRVAVKSNRRDQGRFTTAHHRMEATNRMLAEELAKAIAHAVETGRMATRREAATHKLEKALTDPQNIRSSKDGFGVGNASYLNQAAPYWEVINDGTSRFVGKRITFLRGFGGFPNPHGTRIRMVKDGAGIPRDEGGRFAAGPRANFPIIKNPIKPERYFERGLAAFDPVAKVRAGLSKALRGD